MKIYDNIGNLTLCQVFAIIIMLGLRNMITKEQEKNLKEFFNAMDKVCYQGLYDLGLVIKSNNQRAKYLKKFIPQARKSNEFMFNSKLIADDLLEFIINTFKQKKWGLVELEDAFLPGKVYNQLRLLSMSNRLQIFEQEKEIINLKQPEECRLIIISSKEVLSQIKIPTFLRLFGPIINLT